MKMLTGLLPPTEGSATLFGQSVEAGSLEVRKNLGYMTQAFSLYGELTVRQNLVLDARLYHIPPRRRKRASRNWSKNSASDRISIHWPRICRWVCAAAFAGGRRSA
jgi:ABC-type multidrug transport system ATPase subunit